MSNTLRSTIGVRYSSEGVPDMSVAAIETVQSLASNIRVQGVQNIDTVHEAIELATMTQDGGPGYFFNRDATNAVEIGREIASAFEAFVKLPPRSGAFLPGISDRNLYAKSDVAPVDLEYIIWAP